MRALVCVLHLKKLNSQRDQIGYHPNLIMATRVTSSGLGNETRRKNWRDSSGQGPHKQQFQRRPWFSECDFLSTSSLRPSLEAAHEVGIKLQTRNINNPSCEQFWQWTSTLRGESGLYLSPNFNLSSKGFQDHPFRRRYSAGKGPGREN